MTVRGTGFFDRTSRIFRRARHTSCLLAGIALWSVAASTYALQPFRYQGFNMMAFNKSDYADEMLVDMSLDYVVSRGSNLVVIDWNVAVDEEGSVLPQTSPRSFEPPRVDILRLVERARARGLKVFLKPHIGFPDTPFGNRATWNTDMSRFSVDTFFEQWSSYVVGLGGMASSQGVDAIVIGTENIGFDSGYREKWLSLIAALRQGYGGKIAYGAHFVVDDPGRFTDVCFWDAVDIIGLSLYVALSKNDHASLAELNAAWHSNPHGSFGDIPAYLRALASKYNKPVMALEGGYQSIAGGLFDVGPVDAARPVDNDVQARGMASYLDTLGKYQADWFWGLSNWVVYPPMMNPADQVGWGYLQGYMTNGKPAAEVIRKYFSGELTYSDPTFTGKAGGDRVFGSYAADWITAGAGDDFVSGGVGDDSIIAGPAALARNQSARIAIRATGDVLASGGPRLRLMVNGHAIGGWLEITAPRGAAVQTIEFDVPLGTRVDSFTIETLADPEFPAGVNRTITIVSISVNGAELPQSDAMYAVGGVVIKGAGSWNRLYSGTTLVQDVTYRQSAFFGAASDNDVIVGGEGNDRIDGGTGINASIYSGKYESYTLLPTAEGFTITDNAGTEGTDTLSNVSILQFADRVVDLRGGVNKPVPVVEFFNPTLDHYFITWLPAERVNLYLRKTATPWIPTGLAFMAHAQPVADSSPVCRYYLPPASGDSHFFGRGSTECMETGAKNPSFVLEDGHFMYMKLPAAGSCSPDTLPVYRLFSNRADANHRYTTDRAVRDAMVAKAGSPKVTALTG